MYYLEVENHILANAATWWQKLPAYFYEQDRLGEAGGGGRGHSGHFLKNCARAKTKVKLKIDECCINSLSHTQMHTYIGHERLKTFNVLHIFLNLTTVWVVFTELRKNIHVEHRYGGTLTAKIQLRMLPPQLTPLYLRSSQVFSKKFFK
jgi:hypothetical protein